MGLYDIFVEEDKSVQLKNFDCVLHTYKVGDKVDLLKYRYPETCAFTCFASKGLFVHCVRDHFVGIKKELPEGTPVFDCGGEYMGNYPNLTDSPTGEMWSKAIRTVLEEGKITRKDDSK